MTELKLTPFQSDIVDKICAMRRLTASTGFRTNRSVAAVLGSLKPTDLAAVAQALDREKEIENDRIDFDQN
jgi:hypothetical protein